MKVTPGSFLFSLGFGEGGVGWGVEGRGWGGGKPNWINNIIKKELSGKPF